MKIERESPTHLPIKKITVTQSPCILGKPTDRTVTLRPYKYGVQINHKSHTEDDYSCVVGHFKLNTRAARELAEALCVLTDDMEEG